jgi:TfoX/Sxy family transcriptional regulator of competence genes
MRSIVIVCFDKDERNAAIMAPSEVLTNRVREALQDVASVEEKRMFGGLAFMVDGKMCINVGKDRLMLRIDPALYEAALARVGCTSVVMRGRETRGYVYVSEDALDSDDAFAYWIGMALDYNPKAAPARGTKKQRTSART